MPNSHSPRRQTNWQKIYAHVTKRGPRRYHRAAVNPPGSKLWHKCPEKRSDWYAGGKGKR